MSRLSDFVSRIFLLLHIFSPCFFVLSSSTSLRSTVLLNTTRMSQLIDDFMSLNTTFPFSFPSSTESLSSWSFPIYHKEIFTKSTFKDYESMVLARFENDKARIKRKASRLDQHPDYDDPYSMTLFNTHGTYVAALRVGGLRQELIVDLGSSLIWWNCNPCKNCPEPKFGRPRYDPKKSFSYGVVPCRTFWCDSNRFSIIDGCDQLTSHTCLYEINYVDGSYSKGELGYEKLTTMSNDRIADTVAFGCSRELSVGNTINDYATGILGLDQGDFSIIRQLNVTNFTMCLPTFNQYLASSLKLHYVPDLRFVSDVTTAPLVDNPYDTNYFVGLNRIYVGGEWLSNIPDDVWQIKAYADGGVLLDTGSYLSWLPAAAYYPFRDMFRNSARSMGLQRAKGFGNLDTCYIISSPLSSTRIPSVGFGFRDVYGLYYLQADQILDPVNNKGKYCLAFAKNNENYTIIGAFQLQRTRLAFDLATKVVELLPNDCK